MFNLCLISMCLGMFLLGFILCGILCTSWTWLTISCSMLEKFSTIISSKIFSYLFIFSSSSVLFCALVTQSCLILCDLEDCNPPDFSVYGILKARLLEGIAIPFSRGSSKTRDQNLVSWISGRFFPIWATGKLGRLEKLQSSSGTPIIRMLVCLMFSLRWSSVLFILFNLVCSSEVIFTILSSSSLIRSDIVLLITSRVFLISVIVLFGSVCLFFNSSRS